MKTTLSILTFTLLTSSLAAGNGLLNLPSFLKQDNHKGFYVGAGYGYGEIKNEINRNELDIFGSYNSGFLKAGYTYNKYISIEARQWLASPETDKYNDEWKTKTFSIYLKPSYPIYKNLSVIGLVGFSRNVIRFNDDVNLDLVVAPEDDRTDGFSYGFGFEYDITPNIIVATDYVNIFTSENTAFGNKITTTNDLFNLSLSYKF